MMIMIFDLEGLEFELAYFKVVIQYSSHYALGTLLKILGWVKSFTISTMKHNLVVPDAFANFKVVKVTNHSVP